MSLISNITDKIKEMIISANEWILKRRKTIMAVFGALAAILCLLLLVSRFQQSNERKTGTTHLGVVQNAARTVINKPSIPAEEIFLADEPDFLPKVLLEKDPRKWSAEDARVFWTNPLENERINWRETITNVVNEIMEKVP